jgi:GNAT superfamily N-acetyltransferase
MPLTVEPLTPARRADLDALFDAKGCSMARSCQCMYYRETAATATKDRDARRAALHALADRDPAIGLLAYDGATPVGWVAVGPRADYPRLVRSPVAKAVDELPVWSLVCFVVPPSRRGQGVARALLTGAVGYARAQGAVALEAYPLDKHPPGDAAWLWNGAVSSYRKAGFVEVARRRPERPVVRRWFRGVDADGDADGDAGSPDDDPRPALLTALHDEIAAWERALTGPPDAPSDVPRTANAWSLHDVVGHLAGWHEVTRARLRAAAARSAPTFPAWLGAQTPRSEDALHAANARLLAERRARPWPEVLAGWRAAHAEVLERLAHVDVADLTTVGRFEGLPNHALAAVVESAVAHHAHHRAQLEP